MTRIIQGVLDFQRRVFGQKRELFQQLGKGQKPVGLFITCSDSRISPGTLTQTQPGELFILRNAGNIVPPHSAGPWAEAATVEYAVAHLRVSEIILCGHSHCGAMHGLLAPEALAKLPTVAGWLEHAKEVLPKVPRDVTPEEQLRLAIEQNVLLQLEHLKTHPAVRDAVAARKLRLHGWVYHFEQGRVDVYDPLSGKFVCLEKHTQLKWHREEVADDTPRSEWDTSI